MLNLNTTLYSSQGVDINNVANVSSQILNSARNQQVQIQPQVQNIDYSKFNRATLGVDLYSSRTSPDLQKQISLIQAGLYTQAVNVAKLNSQAALNLYSASTVQKNVEKTQSIQSSELTPVKIVEALPNTVELFNITDKNSNSSNGFNPFKANDEGKNREDKK